LFTDTGGPCGNFYEFSELRTLDDRGLRVVQFVEFQFDGRLEASATGRGPSDEEGSVVDDVEIRKSVSVTEDGVSCRVDGENEWVLLIVVVLIVVRDSRGEETGQQRCHVVVVGAVGVVVVGFLLLLLLLG